MDDLLDQFLLESRDLIAQAAADFAVLRQRADDKAALDSAFRAIHTLKGSVAIFALAPAEQLLHRAEDVLERARKGKEELSRPAVDALVACLDQIDRWMDDMERSGALPADATTSSAVLIAALDGAPAIQPLPPQHISQETAQSGWAEALIERHQDLTAQADRPLTLFRYTPDADCFFRGEDPLAIAMATPDLLALNISPVGDSWPEPMNPFACVSILEGISGADLAAVRSAFRLVASQVEIVTVDPHAHRAPAPATAEAPRTEVLRVAGSRIDALADGIGELIVAVNAIATLVQNVEKLDRGLAASARAIQANLESATGRLRDEVSAVRAVALGDGLRRLPRLAREIADSLGKRIDFTISGEQLEVDRQIADALFEPLLHLVRNAIDHGAEPPEEREALGKPPDCAIALRIVRDGDTILATLTDDGRGMDPARIRTAAVERRLISAEDAAALTDRAALRLIFAPGFSTSESVTAVSGRGVGMDAVQSVIDRLRGTIEVESERGSGTTFRLRLPVNALTTRLLIVEAAGERYGIAFDQIVETARLDERLLRPLGTGRACVLRGRTVPVFDLGAMLGAHEIQHHEARLLVTHASGDAVAVRVDGFAERLDAYVRPPGGLLAAVPGVIGSTLMGDGSVLLVLDLPELLA